MALTVFVVLVASCAAGLGLAALGAALISSRVRDPGSNASLPDAEAER